MKMIAIAIMAALLSTAPVLLKKHAATNEDDKKYLVSAAVKIKSTADELRRDHKQLAMFVKNGYTAYRLTYNTVSPSGKAVVASGAVYVPDTKGALPLFNYNHGTIFPSKEGSAPSYMGAYDAEGGIGKLFAANGYLVVMPDYIGYGSTKNLEHPYGAYHINAGAVTDMLYAVKEFCRDKELTLSGKNFFSGWSEGAAVTLATVLDLEKNHDENFKPTATVLNAGPYYTSAFGKQVLDAAAPLHYMKSYSWVLQSYNSLYNINRPVTYYFTEPNAGMLKAEGPEADITHSAKELFTAGFRNDFNTGKDTAMMNALKANDLWTGKPESPVIFCHGDEDNYVPLFNSQKAYDEMKAKGADVQLKIFKGQNHTSGVFNYLQTAFMAFEGKRY
jgi:pimeloyl-ACP methyl ester carboxylesterase